MNRTPLSVIWELEKKNVISLLGRPLLDYEKTSFPVINPKTNEIESGEIIGK